MRIDVLTLFPDMFRAVLGESIIGRAHSEGLVSLNFINIRDFSKDKHRRVDDYPYGAGGGMVMTVQPILSAYHHILDTAKAKPFTVFLTPGGKLFNQETARELAGLSHLVLLCGHYEGVDQRVIDEIADMELSVGDYVLTGGEIPAMLVADAVTRLLPGVLEKGNAQNESHSGHLLEYPQYTRPEKILGRAVPEVLLSGHHARINQWRREQALAKTKASRPDLMEKAVAAGELSDEEIKLLDKADVGEESERE